MRNYAREGLTRTEIRTILAAAASTADVMNTRHATAKVNGWKEKAPSKAAFVDAAVVENNLLRRPILLHGKHLAVGKGDAAIRALLA